MHSLYSLLILEFHRGSNEPRHYETCKCLKSSVKTIITKLRHNFVYYMPIEKRNHNNAVEKKEDLFSRKFLVPYFNVHEHVHNLRILDFYEI